MKMIAKMEKVGMNMNEFVEKLIERLKEIGNQEVIMHGGRCNGKTLTLGHSKGIEHAISIVNEFAEEYNNGWISVEERLPEKDGEYLCQIGTDNRYMEVYSFAKNLKKVDKYDFVGKKHSGFYDFDCEYGHFEISDVVAWQPLPKPYQPKGE